MIKKSRRNADSNKKRLAMTIRERKLDALDMRTNDKVKVTASGTILQQMVDSDDETELVHGNL